MLDNSEMTSNSNLTKRRRLGQGADYQSSSLSDDDLDDVLGEEEPNDYNDDDKVIVDVKRE
jgi:hypothetical protein